MQKNKHEVNRPKFEIRPASFEEAGLFYAQHPAEDERIGCIGHVRMDFGKSGNEFWHTWWPRGTEELNSPEFKSEFSDTFLFTQNVNLPLDKTIADCSKLNGSVSRNNFGEKVQFFKAT